MCHLAIESSLYHPYFIKHSGHLMKIYFLCCMWVFMCVNSAPTLREHNENLLKFLVTVDITFPLVYVTKITDWRLLSNKYSSSSIDLTIWLLPSSGIANGGKVTTVDDELLNIRVAFIGVALQHFPVIWMERKICVVPHTKKNAVATYLYHELKIFQHLLHRQIQLDYIYEKIKWSIFSDLQLTTTYFLVYSQGSRQYLQI